MKQWLKGPFFFGWGNMKWFVREVRETFSNKPSYFSRKRIESFIMFVNAMVLLDAWYLYNFKEIDYVMALAVFGAQMAYAGYQVTQIRKDIMGKVGISGGKEEDKKEEEKKEDEPKQE